MGLSLITFACGLSLGSFLTVLGLALANPKEPEFMTPEEFEKYKREWDELNDEYDVYDDMTAEELFLDLGDDDEDQ